MPLIFKKKDITKMDVDVIVSSATFNPVVGEGVDFAIHQAAGIQLLEARKLLGSIAVGEAFITPAFKLPAKFVIHAVGPIWNGGGNNEAEDLKKCYLSALKLATENGCESIALPIISVGEKGYPRDEALIIAKQTIIEFIEEKELIVYLVDHDKTFAELSKELFNKLRTYINTNYVNQDYDIKCSVSKIDYRGKKLNTEYDRRVPQEVYSLSREDLDDELEESFAIALLRIIDEKGMADADVYNSVLIDRRLFFKIKNNINYHPSKKTAILFCIALQLNYKETKGLLGRAGYALSNSDMFDIVIKFCIKNNIFNTWEIDEILEYYGRDTLFSEE